MNQAELSFDPADRFHADNFVSHFRALVHAVDGGARELIVVDAQGERHFSFATLDMRARAIAAKLQARYAFGSRVLLMLDNDEYYVQSFLACLYAGMIAVPVFPPESVRPQHMSRLTGIAEDAQASCVVISAALKQVIEDGAESFFGHADLLSVEVIADARADQWREHRPQAGDIAFLQYTSGSTSAPKGVMVSHGNLIANEIAISRSMQVRDDDVFVSWLPLYHDMGLIGGLLQPLARGLKGVLCSPRFFLERPIRWLEMVSQHRATISGGPDFAFRLCQERLKPSQLQGLDLSSWRVAFCGAEPIRAETLAGFIDSVALAGFKPEAAYPCYGLAEATLLVAGSAHGKGMRATAFDSQAMAGGHAVGSSGQDGLLVACGAVVPDHRVRIADNGQEVASGRVGEIEVSGPSIAQGYWRRPQDSTETFIEHDGQRWLRTGDLGFMHEGQLYIAGRRKDLIIVRGQNVYPQDIERVVEEQVEAVRKGRVAAFAVSGADGESIGVAAEISRSMQKLATPEAIADAITDAVSTGSLEAPSVVILLHPGALPKTSSGKLQRSACRSNWISGELDAWAIFESGRLQSVSAEVQKNRQSSTQSSKQMATSPSEPPTGELEQALAVIWQSALKRAVNSRHADFFRSGGSSLAAMQVVAAVTERWQVAFTPAMLFAQPTLAACAVQIEALQADGILISNIPAADTARFEFPLMCPLTFPLTHAQHGLWLTWQLQPDSSAYNLSGVLELRGALQSDALEDALCDLVERHAALRTLFPMQDGEPVQQVQLINDSRPMLPRTDLRRQPPEKRMAAATMAQQRFCTQAFRLDSELPLRAMLLQLDNEHFQLVLCIHHIVADGWSLDILLNELSLAYQTRCTTQAAPTWPALPLQLGDYAVWQRARMQPGSQEFERQLWYWRTQLEGAPALLTLPADRARRADVQAGEGQHRLQLSSTTSEDLRTLAANHGVSLYSGVLALFKLMLQRLSGQYDLCVGAPMADRQRRETQLLVAYLVNIQVVRTRIDEQQSFAALMTQVQQAVQAAQAHQDLPFDALVTALQPDRIAGANPLFQVKCTQQQVLPSGQRFGELDMHVQLLPNAESHFDLSLDFTDTPTGIEVLLAYAPGLFDAATVAGFAEVFTGLAQQVLTTPSLPLADLHVATPHDVALHPAPSDVFAQWRAAASAQLDAVGVQHEARALSNRQLLCQVEALAGRLQAVGVGPEARVALHAGRSTEFVTGMLAVLAVGGIYVPLDPQLPGERLAWQLQDSGARWVLQGEVQTPAWLLQAGLPVLAINVHANVADAQAFHADSANLVNSVNPQQGAYLIYTSGSTGRPKGVLVTRGGLSNYVDGVLQRLALPVSVRSMAMISTVAADLGHTTLFGALCSGRTLHLIGADLAFDPDSFAAYMDVHAVDVLKIVPSHLQALLNAAHAGQVLPRHTLVLGGEATSWSLLERIAALNPACRVINHYGPSETTVGVLTQDAQHASRQAAALDVGVPISGAQAYVLDVQLRLAPVGVAGELYLGGAGLARAYDGRPGLTAERFVAHPFSRGERLYRSGDRARTLRDGSIEFLGRMDDQVKIRGYRVEPGEVREQLMRLPGVSAAAVLAQGLPDDAERLQLQAYVVATTGIAPDLTAWRAALAQALPDYMVPLITVVPSLPLTANGKLDRQALTQLVMAVTPTVTAQENKNASLSTPAQPDAPQGELEQALASVWAEVLKLPQVGRHDNFFELGGDSILTLKIVARARKLGLRIVPKAMMEKQTVAAIVAAGAVQIIPAAAPAAMPSTAAVTAAVTTLAEQDIALTPVQRWFFEQNFATPQHWNQSILLNTPSLDGELLRRALTLLAQRHESLRLRFTQEQGRWRQRLATSPTLLPLDIIDANEPGAIAAAGELAQRSLDLAKGPLLTATWLKLDEQGRQAQQGRLLLVAHHLIVDGVSWRVLLDDLAHLYHELQHGREPAALPPSASLHAWSQSLHAHAQSQSVQSELGHWRDVVQSPEAPLAVGADNLAGRAADAGFTLDEADTTRLLALGAQADAALRVPPQELLLAVLAHVMCGWSGRENLLFELEGHGREDLPGTLDVSRATGWFTSLYPVRLTPGPQDAEPAAVLAMVRGQLQQVPNNGIGYGLLRYLSSVDSSISNSIRNSIGEALKQGAYPQITFNYLGHVDHRIEPAGWTLASEHAGAQRAGDSRRRTLFEVNARIQQGRLQWQWTYCKDLHDAQQMRELQEELRRTLLHWLHVFDGTIPDAVRMRSSSAIATTAQHAKDIYALSPMQAGMLFHSQLDNGDGAYLNQLRLDLSDLDVAGFHAAWLHAVQRHPILRTGFLQRQATPLQFVVAETVLSFQQIDLSDLSAETQQTQQTQQTLHQQLEQLAAAELAAGFDLEKPGLMRLLLVKTGSHSHHFIWTRHHLLLDGWSSAQLFAEIVRSYAGETVAPPTGSYRDYIDWLQRQDPIAAQTFWRTRLQGLDEPTLLAGTLPRIEDDGVAVAKGYADFSYAMDTMRWQHVRQAATALRVTPNTLLQGAWALVLQRYCGQSCVGFGVTVAGRPAELDGIESTLGLFINTLPLAVSFTPEQHIGDWLRSLQQQNLDMREFEHAALYDIQRWTGRGGRPLFDSILVVENYPMDQALARAADYGLHLSELRLHEQTSYPLTVVATVQDGLNLRFGYDCSCFDATQVAALAQQMTHMLNVLSGDTQRRLGECGLCTPAQQTRVMDWSINPQGFDDEQPVHRLFEQQAQLQPDAVALETDGRQWTYAQLNRCANRLAQRLQAIGIGPDNVVALLAERSATMVIALLAVLKSGAAYLPLDQDYPAERLVTMLEDSRPACLLSHRGLHQHLSLPAGLQLIELDELDKEEPHNFNDHVAGNDFNPQPLLHGENLAYVIYTSGSTGKPKGAGNRHRSLSNRLQWMQQAYALQPHDVVLQKTPFGFDVSVWEFLWPLMTGARLVMAPPGAHRDPQQLAEVIRTHGVSTLHFVPSMLQAFLASGEATACTSLRRVICSGEALAAEARDKLLASLPAVALYNLYGPTEAAIDVTHWTCRRGDSGGVPIGRPISATRTCVLDVDLNPVPCGVAGELYLGGIGLARGYLGRPALTAERFIASPFDQGERLYRTGDLVRWREDGQIEYLGRLDHQVKIRGLRIELGEIEAHLLAQDEVDEAVVVAHDNGAGPVLLGYVASRNWRTQTPDSLKTALARRLPDYMVPTLLIPLAALPLSANGKIDRKALPPPRRGTSAADVTHAPPQGAIEQRLAQLWQELLGVPQVGRFDHFFELGGHSLLASSLVARVRYQWHTDDATGPAGVVLPLRFVFEHPRLHEMAACIEGQAAIAAQQLAPLAMQATGHAARLVPVPRGISMPLSPAQHRLWLVDRLANANDAVAYNMSAALALTGAPDSVLLEQALTLLIDRHEILHTGFDEDDDGNPCAVIGNTPFLLERHDVSHLEPSAQQQNLLLLRREHAARRFDLRKAPLLRAALVRQDEQHHQLLFAVHHIVADGWSVALMINELAAAYRALHQGQTYAPPPLAVQYADYAVWQQAVAGGETQMKSAGWWRDTLNGAPTVPYLQSPDTRPARTSHAGQRLRVQLPTSLRRAVEALAAREATTPYAVLLASFSWLLHQRSGAGDFIIGTDVAGRSHPDLEPLVGFFVNVLPLRLRPAALTPQAGFAAWLRHCASVSLAAFEHQELPFERIAEAAGVARDRRWNPLVQVLFVLQNTPHATLSLPGLQADMLEPVDTWSKFDLALFVDEGTADANGATGWRADWVYAEALFDHASIASLSQDWQGLLEQVLASPWAPLATPMPQTLPVPATAVVTAVVSVITSVDTLSEKTDMNAVSTNAASVPGGSKLDKLRSLKGRSPSVADAAPRQLIKTSFLQPGRAFPLVIEPAAGGLDMVDWARRERGYIADMLCRHGGLLFRNFGLRTAADFETFAEAIEPELYGSYGDLPKKEGGKNTYRSTPYPEKEMILFHNESAHMDRWPRKQWFFCELPSPVGGATPIVDCREVYRCLPPELAQRFEQRQLLYIRTFTERLDVSWRDFFKTDDKRTVEARLEAAGIEYSWLANDELQTRTLCPAVIIHPETGERVFFNQVQLHHVSCLDASVRQDLLAMVGMQRMPRHVTYGDGSAIDEQTMALVGSLYEQCAVRADWRQGDVMMLDNMLAAHARDPYEGPRKIVVAMGAMFDRKDLIVPAQSQNAY